MISSRLLSVFFASFLALAPGVLAVKPDPGQICISVGRLLEHSHYNQQKLDPEISRELLDNYLEALDPRHLYFTQKDVEALRLKYASRLSDDILLGNPSAAVEIFNLYRTRIEARVAKNLEIIEAQPFDFKSKRTITVNRQKAPWPKDETEADQLWSNWLENEFLQEKLSEHPLDTPKNVLTRRYNQVLKNLKEQTDADVVDLFLTTLAQTYDPHSQYMSQSDMENFTIAMKLKLFGIGAQLQSEDGYTKIMDLIAGGPAQKDGRLKVGDRISAVAQGEGEFSDVIDMKLDKVVQLIRGKKGTTVRLQIIPAAGGDPSNRSVVELVRDEVKLKEAEAKAEIIEVKDSNGHTKRLGWLTLPSFYGDMETKKTSPTADVRRLLERLKKEGIAGLVIDLRNNGGGSLDEAVDLTGLFIKSGPVVQVKPTNGRIGVLRDTDPGVAYDGPLVVVTNTFSASASEIFAGALQDYGRAVIVGDRHTFGKGTVQTLLDISRFIPFLGGNNGEAGALKLTIQKFYRVAGGSTQLHGVASDVVLPSIFDHDDFGEKSLKKPMPYDEVPPANYTRVDQPLFLDELRELSKGRVTRDIEFTYVKEDLARRDEKIKSNTLSLNEKERRGEIEREKARKEARTAERAKRKTPELVAYALTLDNVDKPELELVKNDLDKPEASPTPTPTPKPTPKKKAATKGKAKPSADDHNIAPPTFLPEEDDEPKVDPIKHETLNILTDLIELSNKRKTAAVAP
ncbi:MAG TPA: carboxy terminal-processing peptidase [Chthoniobacteraceae bacterium]|nr:carboxy terminal-processing peptidase [Chthoniobacteraceae bacterium]